MNARPASSGEAPHPIHDVGHAAALVPPCYFAVALLSFAISLAAAPFLAPTLADYFYQAHILAVVHGLTLGWISATMLGVLYRYVPALAKAKLPYPRLAVVQTLLFLSGAAGLIASFWTGQWVSTAWAAACLVLAAILAGVNLWPLLLRAPRFGVAEIGVLTATLFFVAAATLGTLLALDKQSSFLGGSMLTNLGAHVHLAAVGWVAVTLCALSFRLLPAFLLPTVQFPETARWLIGVLSAAVILLVASLLVQSRLSPVFAVVVGVTLLAYLATLGRVAASHRMPIDWTARHAMAGGFWLFATVAAGCTLAFVGAQTNIGARLAAAYGVGGLLGWISNLIIGISYKLFPGFIAGARVELGKAKVLVNQLGVPERSKPFVFILYNLGVLATVGALLAANVTALVFATSLLAGSALLYAALSLRTVSFVLFDPTAGTRDDS